MHWRRHWERKDHKGLTPYELDKEAQKDSGMPKKRTSSEPRDKFEIYFRNNDDGNKLYEVYEACRFHQKFISKSNVS